MIKVIRTTESYSFIGSWNRFMVSGKSEAKRS